MPGSANRYSMITVPPISTPVLTPNTVMSGSNEGRSACPNRM